MCRSSAMLQRCYVAAVSLRGYALSSGTFTGPCAAHPRAYQLRCRPPAATLAMPNRCVAAVFGQRC
eukprot:13348752-Alexandrium_andersonii.AAC.1